MAEDLRPYQCPSVCLPENVIPSAGATRASFQSTSIVAVLLPESFRGGCSFGVGRPDLSRDDFGAC